MQARRDGTGQAGRRAALRRGARGWLAPLPLLFVSAAGLAQEAEPLEPEVLDAPMSAIDWLSDSVAVPPPGEPGVVTLPATLPETLPGTVPGASPDGPQLPVTILLPGADRALPLPAPAPLDPVAVAPLDAPGTTPDAIGILSPAVTGLPPGLWGTARPEDVARRIRAESPEMLPALQALLQTILLAELDPPRGPGGDGREVFLARVDKLLQTGALEPANALLERGPHDDPRIVRRHFDVALLLGEEQPLCEVLAASPQLSPTYQARIFCLARAGQWSNAALLLGTGTALDLIPEADAALFGRFLDPELYEGEPPLEMPLNPTPLTFRMYEAIGEAIPTQGLPLAFAHSDLRANIGWKARVEAGERLARTGAVSDNQLYGLYTEREPAASGGVWDRVAALQAVEAGVEAADGGATSKALPDLWAALTQARVEVPIARILGPRLAGMTLKGEAAEIAFRMALLSDDYETLAAAAHPGTPEDSLLVGIAEGRVRAARVDDPRAQAVIDGFNSAALPPRLAALVDEDRLGEAILRAITLLSEGTSGDLDQVTDALALFRSVGLEDTARRAALEFLILDRRG
ncbi:MAG: hypothetical protein KDK28_13000 [Maritimibacter sp.]|nr:hypothetical protein [Maritimibacter sp.]